MQYECNERNHVNYHHHPQRQQKEQAKENEKACYSGIMASNGTTNTEQKCRIPKTLQAVFIASNRGNEVHQPPPRQVAFKTFFRGLLSGKGWRNNPSNTTTSSSGHKNSKGKGCSTSKKGNDNNMKRKNSSRRLKNNNNINNNIGKNKDFKMDEEKSCTSKSQKKPALLSSKSVKKLSKEDDKAQCPQEFLDNLMKRRGYSTKRFNTLHTAYHNKPTPLQKASYDVHLIDLVRQHDTYELDSILRAGISPNPCNLYGESLVHMVCRRGEEELLQIMIQNGCNIQVADDYGRTPLHDACWAAQPAFATVELLLDRDVTLLQMTDCRGFLPLSYVRKDHWGPWVQFLESKQDLYWPNVPEMSAPSSSTTATKDGDGVVSSSRNDKRPRKLLASYLVHEQPHTRPLQDPVNALPLDLAAMVAAGKITPEKGIDLHYQRLAASFDSSSDSDDDDDDDVSSLESSSSSSDFSFMDDELEEIVGTIGLRLQGVRTNDMTTTTTCPSTTSTTAITGTATVTNIPENITNTTTATTTTTMNSSTDSTRSNGTEITHQTSSSSSLASFIPGAIVIEQLLSD